ncbi:MAG: excinuclease ABC subunit C [Niallia nealsonii]|nr:excinuclease ABC subunit C [Niallia nealsonii]
MYNNNAIEIDDIKQQVKQLIQDNLYREVTPETNFKVSGIYMIYIDNFTSDKIVPIYIGQATDIQRRYKQHFLEIIALNRLSYDEYNKYFFLKSSSFYEGRFKACKIFKYMLENNCTLKDFRMIIIEDVEAEYLDEKEQEYFKRLLPSFYGFNQFNSFLELQKNRFSNSQISDSEIDDFLSVLLEDVKGIYSYYEYGFTSFNFEHAFPKNINYLLEENDSLSNKTILKYDEVKLKVDELCKLYKLDIEKSELKSEIEILEENINKLEESKEIANEEYNEALNLLETAITEKFKEMNIYANKIPINNFISSIFSNEKDKYRERFYKYLKGKQCELNIYEIFDDKIKSVEKTSLVMNNKNDLYNQACRLRMETLNKNLHERYKMIFPSSQFESFSLGDRSNNLSIKLNEDNDLFNTCHIQIYISNDGNSRSNEYDKEPFIIRLDYCYIDNDRNKTENEYYIDNETTRNSLAGIEYFEKDYYNMFAFRKEKFKISSLINNEIENSFISVQAEYKHGINDYTLRDKELIKLSVVLDEIKQITDEETRFNIEVSESANCLKKCIMNEGLYKNEFVEQIFLTKNLLKLKKRQKPQIKKATERVKSVKEAKKVVDKIDVTAKRSEAYKQKVLIKSDNAIKVLNYVSSKEKVTAVCNSCGYEWKIRSDHLLSRTYCPSCRKVTNNI